MSSFNSKSSIRVSLRAIHELENTIIRMMNENDKAMLTLKRANQMKMNDLTHQLAMEQIDLEKTKVNAETEQKTKII